ncbi:MAG: hypothetical protein R3F07_16040 [Opitutaceae bacterium]
MITFTHRGFYLHASWQYAYPFAVRSWKLEDYVGMFRVLRELGLDRVMIWPMAEIVPPPISNPDRDYLLGFRRIVDEAHDLGLECWLVLCANLTCTDAVRAQPCRDRVFYPHMRRFLLDDPDERRVCMNHLREVMVCLNNADGYVFIDGDPGGYPGAKPEDFMAMLGQVRRILEETRPGESPKIIPWVWSGWGADWENEGVWKPDLRKLVRPFLASLKNNPPGEPWELLPGRSIREGHANGRINFEMTEEAGLLDRSTLLTYEIIEFEPTPPAFVIQFDDIRRVIRQEQPLSPRVRGIMGNAQQPLTALHNLFYFARCAEDPGWLDRSDEDVLRALAAFLGGDADLLLPAWTIARADFDHVPSDLAGRLRRSGLRSEVARSLPGGSGTYLEILALFVDARIGVLRLASTDPADSSRATAGLASAVESVIRWWLRHRYVYDGNEGPDFQWKHTHAALLDSLRKWVDDLPGPIDETFIQQVIGQLTTGNSPEGVVMISAIRDLLSSEGRIGRH